MKQTRHSSQRRNPFRPTRGLLLAIIAVVILGVVGPQQHSGASTTAEATPCTESLRIARETFGSQSFRVGDAQSEACLYEFAFAKGSYYLDLPVQELAVAIGVNHNQPLGYEGGIYAAHLMQVFESSGYQALFSAYGKTRDGAVVVVSSRLVFVPQFGREVPVVSVTFFPNFMFAFREIINTGAVPVG